MATTFKPDARKALLTAAVAAAFISASPLLMQGAIFGGVAHAAQTTTRHDSDDHVMAKRPTNEMASAAKSTYVAPAIADNDMDGDNALSNSDKRDESHYCKDGRACR